MFQTTNQINNMIIGISYKLMAVPQCKQAISDHFGDSFFFISDCFTHMIQHDEQALRIA